jgi:hypothetical protein
MLMRAFNSASELADIAFHLLSFERCWNPPLGGAVEGFTRRKP